jgi:predicted enzyme related to lactoylglutathione lyase
MRGSHPVLGQVGYLQIPAVDLARSAAFYRAVFGWTVDGDGGGFTAPGMIGQLTTELPVGAGGPLLWIWAESAFPTLAAVGEHGGRVHGRPELDGGERWLVQVDDPAGSRIGIVFPVRPPQVQPMLAVRDVEASSRWYQHLLGLRSDHGGVEYERLLAGSTLVLQLHHRDVGHHHGVIAEPDRPVGNGMLVWFGEVSDFDDVVTRAAELGAPVVQAPHRNPPEGRGNGPGHREIWVQDPDGYTVVVASPDGEAWEAAH